MLQATKSLKNIDEPNYNPVGCTDEQISYAKTNYNLVGYSGKPYMNCNLLGVVQANQFIGPNLSLNKTKPSQSSSLVTEQNQFITIIIISHGLTNKPNTTKNQSSSTTNLQQIKQQIQTN